LVLPKINIRSPRPSKLWRRRIKGGSLFHALFAIFIIGALLTTMLSMSFFQKKVAIRFDQKNRLIENIQSVTELVESGYPVSQNGEFLDLFNNGTDSVYLISRSWGLFNLVAVKAQRNQFSKSRTFFVGQFIDPSKRKSLYLADRNQALKLTGQTKIDGKVMLPQKGVERGYINGSNYNGEKLVYGTTSTSDKSLPEFNAALQQQNMQYLNGGLLPTDSLVAMPQPFDSLSHPFTENTIVINQSGWLFLDQLHISGNVMIRSDKAITIRNTSTLSEVLLYAPYIEIETGFKGNVQCFATDSLKVMELVHLDYPSTLAVLDDQKLNEVKKLEIGVGSIIQGQVLIYDEFVDFRKLPILALAEESIIEGEVYSNGFTEAKGTIHGSIYTRKFLLRTPSSSYENYLKDAVINSDGLSKYFLGGKLINNGEYQNSILKWVE
jgi:hypothetical protein